jgi:hypothetical protein
MKKGDKVTMLFWYAGLVSEEQSEVYKAHKDGTVTLVNDFRFDVKSGRCLNDNTWDGARRSLKIN